MPSNELPHDEVGIEDISKAKKLLESRGYKVSAQPLEWSEMAVVVSVKVRALKPTDKALAAFVKNVIEDRLNALSSIQSAMPNSGIQQMGNLEVKGLGRVKAHWKRAWNEEQEAAYQRRSGGGN